MLYLFDISTFLVILYEFFKQVEFPCYFSYNDHKLSTESQNNSKNYEKKNQHEIITNDFYIFDERIDILCIDFGRNNKE